MKKGKMLFALALLILVVGAIGCTEVDKKDEKISENETVSADESVRIDLYVMSQCPYGLQVENVMPEVKEKLGDSLDINIEFIGLEKDGKFNSLHGQPEIDGNMIQLCVKDTNPEKLIDFIVCQNENNPRDLVASIDKCAEKTGIDAAAIKELMHIAFI